jgi:hypothetical protein
VLWPSSDRTIDVVAGDAPYPLTLVADEKHVLSLPGRR